MGRHEVELIEDGRTLRRLEVQPLQVLAASEEPIELAPDLVFNESERPSLDTRQRPGSPAYDTAKRTWLLVKTVRCGAPGR